MLNDKQPLSKLIILNIHESNKHISAKYTLNEFRQKFWLLCGKRIVRNITRACITCRKRHCKSYRYPPSPPPPTNSTIHVRFLLLEYITLDQVLFKIFTLLKMTLAWVALYKCTASRGICLDLVPNMNSASFIRSFKRFISRYGCPDVISDNRSNCF